MWQTSALCTFAFVFAITHARNCSTWLHSSEDGVCVCGSTIGTAIICNNETQEVAILEWYCLTSDADGSNKSVAGRCFVVYKPGVQSQTPAGEYYRVAPQLARQENKTCGHLNRQGQMCGQCKPRHYVSAYSYDMKCYQCMASTWSNVMLYITIAYLPLTMFLCVVVALHINVSSPAMNVPVLYCQVVSAPFVLRFMFQFIHNRDLLLYIKTLATIYGVWNLDFFRTVIPPICLPLNTMQLLALDYLVALYPLLLLVCFYVIVTARQRGCTLIAKIWRPFFWCTARMRQQCNIRSSIIDAFATFCVLSYIKLLNTSMDLLTATYIRNEYGHFVGYFLFNDATIHYLGPQHKPYAVLAIGVILVGILSPLLLMLLYPMLWFQKCLNRCHLNGLGLQRFMRCFHGCYRDRTDGGMEWRHFSAVYPSFRILFYLMYSITLSGMFNLALIPLCIIVVFLILIVQPYNNKYKVHYKLDIFMLLCLVLVVAGTIETATAYDERQVTQTYGYIVACTFCATPLAYFVIKLIRHATFSRCIIWQQILRKNTEQYEEVI